MSLNVHNTNSILKDLPNVLQIGPMSLNMLQHLSSELIWNAYVVNMLNPWAWKGNLKSISLTLDFWNSICTSNTSKLTYYCK